MAKLLPFLASLFVNLKEENVLRKFIFYLHVYKLKKILLIAHRGLWKTPKTAQNSLQAVKAAIALPADGVEIDVRMTKDEVLYLSHDAKINGVRLQTTTSFVIDKLSLSNGGAPARYTDFIALVKKHADLKLYIEIKPIGRRHHRKILIQKAISLLQKHQLLSRTIILSFSFTVLKEVLQYAPGVTVMYLLERRWLLRLNRLRKHAVQWVGFSLNLVKKRPHLVEKVHQKGMNVNVWTVNTSSEAKALLKYPISSITSDTPDQIIF